MTTETIFNVILILMIINTIIAIITLVVQIRTSMRKEIPKDNTELIKCKVASMQLFTGISKLMELMEDGRKWNNIRTAHVLKEMDEESERRGYGKKTNPEGKIRS